MTEHTSPLAVVVLAAGAGTRMKSKTQKTLHRIGGRSMLAHCLYAAAGMQPERIVTVIGHRREQVEPAVVAVAEELASTAPQTTIETVVQEEQNGTGHAVQCAMAALEGFEGTVVVTNADVPLLRSETLTRLAAAHNAAPTAVTVLTMDLDDPTGYGRIVRSDDGAVTAIVEQKDGDEATLQIHEVNSGVFAFDAQILRSALQELRADNAQGELYLTDVLGIAREQGHHVRAYQAEDAGELAGVNDRVQLAAAGFELNRRTVEAAMRAGATVIDPNSTWIDVEVTIGQDVTIYPGTQLLGRTSIGDDAVIGPDTTLDNVQVAEGASVIRTHGLDSEIGKHAQVGPFSYLRPGTKLGEEGKLGGFVEAKNAVIGRGSKVPHLTYIGDATVGEESNIGASSVFVNYDGVNKHHTTIGSHVRTGSDTMFIAPVNVGDGAYSGAGTVIKEDVPPGALVVSGGKQRNIEGWVARKRPGTKAAEAAEAAQQASGHHTKEG
ncbi:bifunctional UDP-N-acetylglucosamine diphosphorylase/glucosamine-1-phosphate N-acetyltransferase GlmU [Corynebacterium pelargi]|uniref:Bifunctional protein GlmU n=1 Tax=Corynebacterium pelargi TaxID=1471400 RepID=A0A410W9V5_9CORY|nr:bifunctional UDP-N-acetylglucosamine diphosphorylase/glucosamine-1-phosphate N-acetyltransferase GlmU [Corynebacterium pelargi]QAU52730.1 Bifunctional protein GlmU [Corynebacterium pelargi]GGG78420.1 bifunctional protein GlmU [Corynebacterium pelargi]